MEDLLRGNPLEGGGEPMDEAQLAGTVAEWEGIFRDIQQHLQANDQRMVEAHQRRRDLAVRHLFREGDYVLLRSREQGKLKTRAVGPYIFKGYLGWRGVNAAVV